VTLDCVSGYIAFYRKVSSESCCDHLKFYIDGVEKGSWSDEEDWAKVSFPVDEGTRTFEWTYSKDGSESVLPLRFEYNIRRFDSLSINRATNDNRYIHTLKGADGADVHLFQWEWVNPWPNKRIVYVDVRHDNELDVSLVLLAISGRAAVAGN